MDGISYTLPGLGFAVQYYSGEWICLNDKGAKLATTQDQLEAINEWRVANIRKFNHG